MGLYKNLSLPSYSEYADELEGRKKREKTNEEIKSAAENMILMFLPKDEQEVRHAGHVV